MSATDPSGNSPTDATAAANLSHSLIELLGESQALRTDVRDAEQARRRASRISMAVLGLLGVFIVLLMVVTLQNNAVARQARSTNARMADCTTPGGKCYQEGEARTAQAIGMLIRAQVFMAECARLYPDISGPDYDRKLEACVQARLKTQAMKQGIPPGAGPSESPPATPPTPSSRGGTS